MRTLASLERQEQKLRAEHTKLFQAQKWQQMDTVGRKLRMVLDQMHELKAKADKLLPEADQGEGWKEVVKPPRQGRKTDHVGYCAKHGDYYQDAPDSPCPACEDEPIDETSHEEPGEFKDLHYSQIPKEVSDRLEYLRGEIRAERISYGEISELMGLIDYIDPDDVELLQWAGKPEDET